MFVMYEAGRVPLLCACKIEAKILRSPKKKCHQLFWDLRDFIGWQRTALAFLTPNPHPMLAALHKRNSDLKYDVTVACIKGTSCAEWDAQWHSPKEPETRSGENSYKPSSVKPCFKSVFQNRDSRYAKSYKRSLILIYSKEPFKRL